MKDAVSLKLGEDYYAPTLEQIRTLMGIPKSFDLSFLSKEISVEALGQSVDGPMHRHLATHIKQHIEQHLGACTQKTEAKAMLEACTEVEIVSQHETGQMSLFA